uniref:Uncharacterized protein n=1 Tax=Glossina morsitans morsitans TaxID=37546 RepID=A0A1B0FMN6_GLOMM
MHKQVVLARLKEFVCLFYVSSVCFIYFDLAYLFHKKIHSITKQHLNNFSLVFRSVARSKRILIENLKQY